MPNLGHEGPLVAVPQNCSLLLSGGPANAICWVGLGPPLGRWVDGEMEPQAARWPGEAHWPGRRAALLGHQGCDARALQCRAEAGLAPFHQAQSQGARAHP